MDRYRIINYIVVFLGLATAMFGGAGYYIQSAYRYQIKNNLPLRVSEDSFWLAFDGELIATIGMNVTAFAMLVLIAGYMRSVGPAPAA